MPVGTDLITWLPRKGATSDDRYTIDPNDLKWHWSDSTVMAEPFAPTATEINTLTGVNQVIAEVNRRLLLLSRKSLSYYPAQVSKVTFGTYDVTSTRSITIGATTISASDSGGTIAAAVAALVTLLNASTDPGFASITWSANFAQLIGTADIKGVAFTFLPSVAGGTGTISVPYAVTTAINSVPYITQNEIANKFSASQTFGAIKTKIDTIRSAELQSAYTWDALWAATPKILRPPIIFDLRKALATDHYRVFPATAAAVGGIDRTDCGRFYVFQGNDYNSGQVGSPSFGVFYSGGSNPTNEAGYRYSVLDDVSDNRYWRGTRTASRIQMPTQIPTVGTLKVIVGYSVSSPNNPTIQVYNTGTDLGSWAPTDLTSWDQVKGGTSMGTAVASGTSSATFSQASPSISANTSYTFGLTTTQEQAGFSAMNASLGANDRYAGLSITYLELYT